MPNGEIARIRDDLVKIENDMDNYGDDTYVQASIIGGDELILKFNEAAGVSLCRSILGLIESGIEGKHQHFDRINLVDEGNAKFVFVLQRAP